MNGFHVLVILFLATTVDSELKRFIVGTATQYRITVVTGDIHDASTNAHIFISMNGQHGVTPELLLPSSYHVNYRRGGVDQFNIAAPSVGNITSIHVRSDNHAKNAGWYLEKITIEDGQGVYEFNCKCWFTSHTHSLTRTIKLTKYSS